MTECTRIATRRDYHAMVRIRAEWIDRFCDDHPAGERWCPANAPVPWIEDEAALLGHLPREKGDRWAALLAGEGEADAYILCRTDEAKDELVIERHNPRVSPRVQLDDAGGKLLEFAVRRAAEQGLHRICMPFHGFPDEVGPLIDLYRRHGFQGHPRIEMTIRQLRIDPGPQRLRFRSAEEIGLDAVCEIEARMRDWSPEQTKKNLEFSQRMWSLSDMDWLAAYEGEHPVGTVRMAVTREGVGVVDAFGLLREYRGRGLGIHLLAGGLSCLIGKTDVVWQDVDHDNVPALRVYERAGFRVHHHHGEMALELDVTLSVSQ